MKWPLGWNGVPRRPHAVTVYSKPDCPLCDLAVAVLRDVQFERTLAVDVEDIRTDLKLFERYRERIPVLVFDGRIMLDPPIDAHRVRGVLDRLDREMSHER